MFRVEKLDSRKKFYYVLLFFGLFSIIVYRYTFSKTIDAYKYQQELSTDASRTDMLQTQLKELLVHSNTANFSDIESSRTLEQSRSGLLKTISFYCRQHTMKLVKFPPQHTAEKDGLTVSTSIVVVKGSFRELLGLLFYLERSEKNIRIRNVKFESLRVFQEKKIELFMTLSLQYTYNSNKQ